jgi:hypothetical protein
MVSVGGQFAEKRNWIREECAPKAGPSRLETEAVISVSCQRSDWGRVIGGWGRFRLGRRMAREGKAGRLTLELGHFDVHRLAFGGRDESPATSESKASCPGLLPDGPGGHPLYALT